MYVLAHIPEQFVFVVYAEELLVVIGGLSHIGLWYIEERHIDAIRRRICPPLTPVSATSWSGIYDSLRTNLQYSFLKTERYNTDKDISKLRKRIYVLVLNGWLWKIVSSMCVL